MLRPGGITPVLSWGAIGLTLLVWIAGFPLDNVPFFALAAGAGPSFEVWRFVTSAFVYPSVASAIVSLLLNVLFFLLIAPVTERQFGRAKFALLFFAGTAVGSAAMVLAGSIGFGLSGALWALLGAYLVAIWSNPQARTQFLILLAINALVSLLFGGFGLPALVGGLLAGVGASLVLRRYDDRPRSRPSTPYLLVAAAAAVIVAIAVLRTVALG
jgi:membrane associated rhomboid family serine protease